MNQGPLIGVKACVFDAYGTLFDFAAAAKGCRDVLGDAIDKLTALWRDKQLQYTWLRAVQGRHADFSQVTGDALDFALETLALEKHHWRTARSSPKRQRRTNSGHVAARRDQVARRSALRTQRDDTVWQRPTSIDPAEAASLRKLLRELQRAAA